MVVRFLIAEKPRVITNQDSPLHLYLKDPSKITADVAPYITIPSTAGTGAEITWGGGIHPDVDTPAFGLRSPYLKPDIAICDPEITRTLPPKLTAATGMDAITHCVEGYLSNNYNPISEAVALDGIKRVINYIGRAFGMVRIWRLGKICLWLLSKVGLL